MIEHPLIAYIEDLDRRLDEIIDKQKYLHSASVLGKTTDEQNEDIRKIDEKIKEIIDYRNMAQKNIVWSNSFSHFTQLGVGSLRSPLLFFLIPKNPRMEIFRNQNEIREINIPLYEPKGN